MASFRVTGIGMSENETSLCQQGSLVVDHHSANRANYWGGPFDPNFRWTSWSHHSAGRVTIFQEFDYKPSMCIVSGVALEQVWPLWTSSLGSSVDVFPEEMPGSEPRWTEPATPEKTFCNSQLFDRPNFDDIPVTVEPCFIRWVTNTTYGTRGGGTVHNAQIGD